MKSKISFLVIAFFFALNAFSQNTYVFLGSYNRDKTAESIQVYQLDTINGKLSKITAVKNVVNPSYLTLSPNGKYLYACTETKTPNAGSVSSFEFNPENKTLTFLNSQKSGGENPVYVTVHKSGKWLVNGNYTEGSVSVHPLLENGKIDSLAQNFQYMDGSTNKERQERSHIHSTVFSPQNDYLFMPDLGADKIRCYQFEATQKQPLIETNHPFLKTDLEAGPRHFTFHPNQKFGYCIEEMAGAISVYQYENGVLTKIQRINTHPDNIKEGFESSDIHISPDGKFLYATNRGKENNIAIFSIAENGLLKSIGYQSTLGKHPRIFAIDETGKFLIASNVLTGNVVVFRRNSQTGLLKKVGKEVKMENVSCVQIKNI
ncbi:6-phosphogluconolactonase (cycloisomerase 2 family) [Flavobacterium sp. 90]|uniref:lactonase family protein n=1 Tax=unclassified Flavobacterium TaxID=196869 RepID=UPI000EAEFE09|nr:MULTISPECIES: lactonase family protein [unclassified Flavobacterium]RKR11744.1 6-phosphogluconolactonase (cycloisomerase 2 family) [Flavobacterium sp. 81]TCK55520.1 6-phosphogluconolactonase (cycloisomerase 2 family) [Flavobacterium sp. 90]